MIARRDLLIGGACVATAVAANSLRPNRPVALLKGGTLAEAVPMTFGDWVSQDVGDPLAINGPETLSAKLYNELVTRLYINTKTSAQVLALLAYGGRQTDELQLHRPEVCYPAFGYALVSNEPRPVRLGAGVEVPARRLLAQRDDWKECVIYWTRMGEYLPVSGDEQRADRFRIALSGIIPDGLLARFSGEGSDPERAWAQIESFTAELVRAVPPPARPVLVGTARGRAIG
jgi:EpsI family protein